MPLPERGACSGCSLSPSPRVGTASPEGGAYVAEEITRISCDGIHEFDIAPMGTMAITAEIVRLTALNGRGAACDASGRNDDQGQVKKRNGGADAARSAGSQSCGMGNCVGGTVKRSHAAQSSGHCLWERRVNYLFGQS